MRKCPIMLVAALALCAAQAFADTHTVTFRRMNGTVLSRVEVEHGANATALAPALPAETDMTAKRWDCAEKLANVTNDVTCWALYETTAAKSPSTSIQSNPVVDRGTPYSLDEYFQMYDNLAWSDEFSGTSLDTGRSYSFWGQTYYQGGNWRYLTDHTNNELQQYTEGDNVTLSNGILKITARRETRGDYKFTSAKIASDGCVQVKYGRCEIRAKLTKQQGTWPAFWMIRADPRHGFYSELDIMEQINGYDWIGGCFHRDIRNSTSEPHKTDSNSGVACTEDGTSWGDEFHRIGAIFNEFEIIWYVDDRIFKRMDVRNRDRYSVYHSNSWYILLNLAFGGWAGEEYPDGNDDPRIANFQSEDFEIDYCRVFTNTTVDNTVQREAEPAGAKLSAPVKATIWRGWQMNWAKPGSNYYMDHLIGREANHIQTALREYFARDKPDVVTFMSKPTEHTDEYDKVMSYDVPGVSTVFLSPEQGANNEPGYFGDTRERLLSGVMFNKERFSTSRSAISTLPISNDADFTNCCAVVAELVENDTGAKVKVVSAFAIRTNGVENSGSVVAQGFNTLISKLGAMKDEKVILLLQGEGWANWNYLDNRVKTELNPSFIRLGQFTSFWPTYQSAWVTSNYTASAENPAPLSVPKSNGQPSGVHTNQAYCATVQFEAPEPEPAIEYGQLDMSGFAKKMTVTFSGAQSGTTLTDFPVLVKLSTAISGFSYADFARPNGGDLRFADANGNLLPHEIDTWNSNGVSTVWVKVPHLTKD
ncbi:MAG: DUF2341 domain-containing protein, partial [Kiritimatiellae bacterium]|nr:DUF2341 domain-containing protein [Kiritimatiellia bacterium]